jgi:antitoxin component of MazEF toxin-antitoxin module
MQTTIVKWGNSHGIRIPKAFLHNIHTKKNVKEHKTTKERLTDFYGADFNKKRKPQKEIDWGSPAGKEIW